MCAVAWIFGSSARYPDHTDDDTAPLESFYAHATGDTMEVEARNRIKEAQQPSREQRSNEGRRREAVV